MSNKLGNVKLVSALLETTESAVDDATVSPLIATKFVKSIVWRALLLLMEMPSPAAVMLVRLEKRNSCNAVCCSRRYQHQCLYSCSPDFGTIVSCMNANTPCDAPHIHSVIQSFNHSVIQSFNHSIIQSFNHSVIQSFNHSSIQSFNHSVIRPPGKSNVTS